MPLAFLLTGILIWLLLKFLNIKTRPAKITNSRQLFFAIVRVVIVLPIFFVFVRYGGAFNYANSINFESAERLKSTFLNEAILDDGQTFYRVYKTCKEQQKITDVNITAKNFAKKSLFSAAIRRQIILKILLSERLTSLNLQISRKM